MNIIDKTKAYPLVEGLIGNEGEGTGNLAVISVLDPSESYPQQGRIIVGSNRLSECNLGQFAGTVATVRQLAATLNEACDDVSRACPAQGDLGKAPDSEGRPQRLRTYLVARWRELDTRVKLQSGQSHLADEAEQVGTFIRWMDEAGIGK